MTQLHEQLIAGLCAAWIGFSWFGQLVLDRASRHGALGLASSRAGWLVHGCYALWMACVFCGGKGLVSHTHLVIAGSLALYAGVLSPSQCRLWSGVRGRQVLFAAPVAAFFLMGMSLPESLVVSALAAGMLFVVRLHHVIGSWGMALQELDSLKLKILEIRGWDALRAHAGGTASSDDRRAGSM